MPLDPVDADSGFRLKTSEDEPAKPATVAQVFRALAFADAMQKKRRTPIVHVPQRRENAARPREQRPRSRVKSTARGDPDEPPLAEIPPAVFWRAGDAWRAA
jgi:hypothetical protein